MDIVQTESAKAPIDTLFDNTQLIDMTPDAKPRAAVVESTELTTTTHSQPSGLSSINRAETTAKHVGDILESLDFAAVRLEGAMYRIGYLESQVDSLHEQLKVLPEFRARAAKAILTERQNHVLIETISEYENELNETHELLEKLSKSKTWQFFRWAFGVKL
jgi:DNA repair ATPase RecN